MIRTVVTTAVQSRHDPRNFIQFPVEFENETLDGVFQDLAISGVIYGIRINFDFVGESPSRRVVRERVPQILTLAGILVIGPCPYEIFESAEDIVDV